VDDRRLRRAANGIRSQRPEDPVQTLQKPADFKPSGFLWKLKLEYDPKAATALTQPILLDRVIGFAGSNRSRSSARSLKPCTRSTSISERRLSYQYNYPPVRL
jgi:hypothetical protein